MRRAARHGSGWLPYMYSPEMVEKSLRTIAAERERDLPPIRPGLLIWGCVHREGAAARRMVAAGLQKTYDQDFDRFLDTYCFAGTPPQVVEQLARQVEAGVRTLIVSFACPEDYRSTALDLFTTEVMPELRARFGQ